MLEVPEYIVVLFFFGFSMCIGYVVSRASGGVGGSMFATTCVFGSICFMKYGHEMVYYIRDFFV